MAAQLTVAIGVGLMLGLPGLLAWAGAALVGAVLFQLVNYVEHYGLLRQRTAGGGYERVQPHHSWNSDIPWAASYFTSSPATPTTITWPRGPTTRCATSRTRPRCPPATPA